MDKITVLLAEDEPALAHIVRESLEERDFRVILCANGEEAYAQYLKHRPDILALDVMMPKLDGFKLVKKIREKDNATPIIFLTAKSQVKDVIEGFEIGANDYLKKPYSVEELIVRMKVLLSTNRLLNSPKTVNGQLVQIGSIAFNQAKNWLEFNKGFVHLTARESELLSLFYRHKHEIVSRKQLLEDLWGNDSSFNARSLDVFVTRLRKHLTADPQIQLINVRGVGYKLVW